MMLLRRAAVRSTPADPEVSKVDRLVEWVMKTGIVPIDAYHVAAMLEMDGWTDALSVELGYEDIFHLAEAVFGAVQTRMEHQFTAPRKKPPLWKIIYRTIMLYLQGLTFAMPMLLASFSVLTLKYSFMSYMGFSTEVATGIALGTFLSFGVAGGFSQAIARRGLFYLSQNLYSLARRSSIQLLIVGVIATLLTAVLLFFFMLLVPVLPWSMLRITGLYFLLLTLIWLGAGLLYMLGQAIIILIAIAASIGAVYVQVELYQVGMMQAQAVAMALIGVVTIGVGLLLMVRLERREDSDAAIGRAILPRWSQISRSLAPYFLYGTLYFGLLFADRVMAWSVPGEFHPYVIWFLGDYELGLDWSLWTLVLPMGVIEVYIHVLFDRINQRQQVAPLHQLAAFNARFKREHLMISLLVFIMGVLSLFLILGVIQLLLRVGLLPFDPLAHPVTRFVFFFAAPAYSIVTIGLQNALVLFSLNVPWPAVNAVATSLVVNLIVGFLASRYGGHQWAVLGFASGAVVFAVLSTREALRVLNRLDWHLMRSV